MINPKIKFTIDEESGNKIDYLDVTILKTHNKLCFGIYRKPTTSDLIIHNDSCHPYERIKAAVNYLINHMNQYSLTHANREREKAIIKEILNNNNYSQLNIHQQ
jgi:hypothetical protein